MITVLTRLSMRTLLDAVAALCREAGEIIVDIYQQAEQTPIEVLTKSDNSPLTEADLQANACLVAGLSRLLPGVPILSEELDLPPLSTRQQWSEFWLVDPLDGTKEFIHRTGDFTVNVALISDGRPVLGVVYAPLIDTLYTAINTQAGEDGAFRHSNHQIERISVAHSLHNKKALTIVTSRRHGLAKLDGLLKSMSEKVEIADQVAVGSSLKHCLVAEGRADFYPRFGLTSQWDTAAAQAIVEAAGGYVVSRQWQPLNYDQRESVLNPEFYVIGDSIQAWQTLLGA